MRSIRQRMALALGAAMITLMAVGGGGTYLTLRQMLTAQFDDVLATKAQALISASEIDDGEFEIDFDIQAFAGFGSRAPGDYFEVRTPAGQTMARSPSLGLNHLSVLRGPAEASGRGAEFATVTLPNGRAGRAIVRTFTPRDDDARGFANLNLVVASDVTSLRRTLQTIAAVLAIFGGLGVILALLIVHQVLGAGLRPLSRLAREVQGIDLATRRRISIDQLPSELSPVALKLNELIGRLEETFARERRFSSHAAHELRSPLAELKVMTELGVSWPAEFTEAHGKEMLIVIAELEALLDKLSVLARAESDAAVQRETMDLAAAVNDCVHPHETEIAARKLSLDIHIEEVSVVTDRTLWKAIVTNLIANAVHHAPAGTSITIEASPTELRVSNQAPGLEPDDLAKVFERFWRKSGVSGTHKHSGLGLSIARACAESLGGSCTAQLANGVISVKAVWR